MNEKRKADRHEFAWPVCVWLPNANHFYEGRNINVSRTGAMVSWSIVCPVSISDTIEINFPRTAMLAKKYGQAGRIKVGIVKRVKRESDIALVAVEFTDPNPA